MSNRVRNIVAVVILVVLIFGLMGAAGWYFAQSRHWNVAATTVDDTLGSMDGYTVIAYQGLLAKPRGSSSEVPLPANWDTFLDDQNRGEESPISQWLRRLQGEPTEPPTFEEVVETYTDKGASVLELDVQDTQGYRIPAQISVGEKRVGVVAILSTDSPQRTTHHTKRLEEMEADYLVAIVDKLSAVERVIDRYDVVICTTDQGVGDNGATKGQTLIAQVPIVNYTGTVSIAPSNVASVKTVESL